MVVMRGHILGQVRHCTNDVRELFGNCRLSGLGTGSRLEVHGTVPDSFQNVTCFVRVIDRLALAADSSVLVGDEKVPMTIGVDVKPQVEPGALGSLLNRDCRQPFFELHELLPRENNSCSVVETRTQLVLDSSCVPVPFHTAFGGACFRGAGPGSMAQTSARRMSSHGLVAEDERRRTSRGRHSAPRAPQESGATIPGTRRRPGQTDTRARGSTDHRPPTRHPPPTIGYQSPTPFSSFRVPQGGIND